MRCTLERSERCRRRGGRRIAATGESPANPGTDGANGAGRVSEGQPGYVHPGPAGCPVRGQQLPVCPGRRRTRSAPRSAESTPWGLSWRIRASTTRSCEFRARLADQDSAADRLLQATLAPELVVQVAISLSTVRDTRFAEADCWSCRDRTLYTSSVIRPCSVAVLPGPLHEVQAQNRLDQQWQHRYAIRTGIEAPTLPGRPGPQAAPFPPRWPGPHPRPARPRHGGLHFRPHRRLHRRLHRHHAQATLPGQTLSRSVLSHRMICPTSTAESRH